MWRRSVGVILAAVTIGGSVAVALPAAAVPAPTVVINEVESNGGTPGDWVELKNTGSAAVNVSGYIVKDNDNTHSFTIPANTSIAAGAYLALDVETAYGLGSADSARLFAADGTTLIDSYSWTAHASLTYGRCPDGTGSFAATTASTKGAVNACTAPVLTAADVVKINEVESNGGTPGDWVELKNTGSASVDVSGLVIKDNDDTHIQTIPANTSIAAGGYYTVDTESGSAGFGLGAADSARLFASNGTTLIDSYSWTAHATTTYGRCPDGTGAFSTTTASSRDAANLCGGVVINEVESNGGTPGDWVELKNTGGAAADVSGWLVKDNDDTHIVTIPASTSIAAGGYLVVDTEPTFGLGAADSARLVNGTTLVDSYSWTAHASLTYGRCPDGTGAFAATTASTRGAVNACAGDTPPAAPAATWPGGTAVADADVAGVLGGNMSGLAYERSGTRDSGVLWAVKNGPGTLYRMLWNGTAWVADTANDWTNGKTLRYGNGSGDPDAEGVALTSKGLAGGVYVSTERNNSSSGTSKPAVLRFDATASGTTLNATNEWDLTADLPTVAANSGLEAISWIPDSYLVAQGFVDEHTGALYDPASYSGHGDGLFFVGLEANGAIYAYALDQSGGYTRVATIASGFTGVMDLEFDTERSALWAVCDDTCNGRSATLSIAQSGAGDGKFAVTQVYERPTGMPNYNNEGFTIAPQETCVAGKKAVIWADDTNDADHALRTGTIDCTPKKATINLMDVNDFHGRIDTNTVKVAGTVEQLRAQYGEGNSLFLSVGDNIGASLFASASQQDQPTIDVLNALDLTASAVGNHEFDKGYDDLVNRVIGSAENPNADFAYLGANVYLKGTETPALPEYELATVGGVKVGIIGTVTQETRSLVSPGGVATLDFGDPVEATNRVAAQLSDGDPANGEADVIIAAYHEGAPDSASASVDLASEVAKSPVFASIVNGTSASVDAIFTGHTHQSYAWDAPIPGVAGKTRPVLQTGSYGANIGNVVLTADVGTGAVDSYVAANVPRTTVADSTLVSTYPRVAEVKTITDAALAAADAIGSQVVGSVAADITTAYTGGTYGPTGYTGGSRDDRASESTLGNLVADSLVSSLGSADRGGATIGVVNPGGLRAELLYAPDGSITYAEANSVLPFVNNLWTTSLTGAQFKTVLEQQWQTNADGSIPSRAFLKLGLSKNVQYTFDASRAAGDRVTGIWIDGAKLDPAASYRVGSFSFLVQGGDNFREFVNGTNAKDSGLIDRDAWISYLQANPNLTPSFARGAVSVTGTPAAPVQPGTDVTFEVSGLDLTSKGSPRTASLTATWTGSTATFAAIPVTNGAATVTLKVPANAVPASEIVLTAAGTGTTVRVPISVVPDTTAPTVLYSLSGRTVSLTASDAASGVASVEYRLDSATAWTGYTAPVVLDDAAHTVSYRATDAAGNTSTVRSFSVAPVTPVGPPTLQAQGAARTIEPGGSVTGLGARVVDTTGSPIAGATVTFTISGPGTFPGSATTASAVSNASGVALAPAVTGTAPGSVVVTASLSGAASVALPTVTVAAPAPTLSSLNLVETSIVSGKVVLSVSVKNSGAETVTILVKTKYGTKTFTGMAPGASKTQAFSTYLAKIPAGEVTVTVSSATGQRSYTETYSAVAAG